MACFSTVNVLSFRVVLASAAEDSLTSRPELKANRVTPILDLSVKMLV